MAQLDPQGERDNNLGEDGAISTKKAVWKVGGQQGPGDVDLDFGAEV